MNEILTLDFGGSSVKYALLNDNLEFADAGRVAAPKKDEAEFLSCVQGIYEQFKDRATGIAISFAGTLNDRTGDVYLSGAFPFLAGHNLRQLVEDLCHVPVTVANDATSAALAELQYGCLRNVEDAIVIILGSAIGGTLIHNGEIYYGRHFCAGEFSLIKTDGEDDGLDSIWAKTNGSKGLMRLVQKHKATEEVYSGEEIFDMALHGDDEAMQAIDEFCHKLAIQIYNVQAIFDGDCIAIGGGISEQPLLFELIEKHLSAMFEREAQYGLAIAKPDIVPCEYHNRANLLGAYHFYTSYRDE